MTDRTRRINRIAIELFDESQEMFHALLFERATAPDGGTFIGLRLAGKDNGFFLWLPSDDATVRYGSGLGAPGPQWQWNELDSVDADVVIRQQLERLVAAI